MDARRVSILSMIAASSCCLPPLILLGLTLVGVGTAGFAGVSSTLGLLKWYILPFAVVGVAVSYRLYFRERKKCPTGACRMRNEKLTKSMLTISTVVVIGFLGWSLYPYVLGTRRVPAPGSESSAHFAVYEVEGMTCGGCEIAVDGAINATGLADSTKSSFTNGKVYIWSKDDLRSELIISAIASVGYKAKLKSEN